VAWNEIDISNMSKNDLQKLTQELNMLSELRHKHVIIFHNRWRVGNDKVVYITNLTKSGSLKDFILKVKTIRWKAVKRWSRQILRGLQYLHSHDPPIIHRNLKCSNVFINGASGEIVIGELSLSTNRQNSLSGGIGTPGYMAPEQYHEKYDEKVDIFAFGMMVLEMISGEPPYSECGDNPGEIHRRVMAGVEPLAISRVSEPKARGFIRACLRTTERPTAAELLTHPFLKVKEPELDEQVVTNLPDDLSSVDPREDEFSLASSHRPHDANSGDEWDHSEYADDIKAFGKLGQRSKSLPQYLASPSRASGGSVAVEYINATPGSTLTREVVEAVDVQLKEIDCREEDSWTLRIEMGVTTKPDDEENRNDATITFEYDLKSDNPDTTVEELRRAVENGPSSNFVFEDQEILDSMRDQLAKAVGDVDRALRGGADPASVVEILRGEQGKEASEVDKSVDGSQEGSAVLESPESNADADADAGAHANGDVASQSSDARVDPPSLRHHGSNSTLGSFVEVEQDGPESSEPANKEDDELDYHDPELQAELKRIQDDINLLEKLHLKKLSDFENQRAAEEERYINEVESLKQKHHRLQDRLQAKEKFLVDQYQEKHGTLMKRREEVKMVYRQAERDRLAEEQRVWEKLRQQNGNGASSEQPEGSDLHSPSSEQSPSRNAEGMPATSGRG